MIRFAMLALSAMFIAAPTLSHAQAHDWRAGLAQSEMTTLDFSATFEGNTGRVLETYFTLTVPNVGEVVTTQSRTPDSGNLYEVRYVSLEGQLLEYLTVSSGTISPQSPDQTHQTLFNVIEQFVYPSIQFPAEAEILGGRIADINGLAAVEYMAIRRTQGEPTLVARIVGVASPNGVDAMFFVQQTLAEPMGLGGPDEMAQTYAGIVAGTVVFTAYRDDTGAMVAF